MYKLTPRMLQHFRKDLETYHNLFTGGRCQGWELEELIVRAIRSDTKAHHHVIWQEAGHDDKADIMVTRNGMKYPIQIKSGKIEGKKEKKIVLSGYRLGRFEDNFDAITEYLKSKAANFIAVPYEAIENDAGKTHRYRLAYLGKEALADIDPNRWARVRKRFHQTNNAGVMFDIMPTMSWQIWWKIPIELVDMMDLVDIH